MVLLLPAASRSLTLSLVLSYQAIAPFTTSPWCYRELKDRYSFWHKLLTLMLNGVNDEIPEICQMCTVIVLIAIPLFFVRQDVI